MKDIRPLIQEILPSLVQLRHELHAEPELGFEEVNTSRRVLEKLKSVPGVEIRTGVAKTGIVATLGSEKKGPCVALRAEMDALPIEEATGKPYASKVPGKMHACGHDGHTTCAVGAFLVLSKIQDELKGPVKFVFQPSEESVGGARVMCEEGCLENPKVDAIFGLHGYPIAGNLRLGEVALARGPAMAGSRGFTIEVKGKGGHAAAPHLCIDPVYIGAQIVNAVQSMVSRSTNPLESMVVSVTRFVAGTARNIIPETALLEGTLRALKTDRMDWAVKRLEEIASQTASMHGGSISLKMHEGYPPLVNEDRAAAYVAEVMNSVLPKGSVHDGFPPRMGAEDFAFYLQRVPGTFWSLGLTPKGSPGDVPGLHHPKFDFNDDAIPLAVEMHCEIARRFAESWNKS